MKYVLLFLISIGLLCSCEFSVVKSDLVVKQGGSDSFNPSVASISPQYITLEKTSVVTLKGSDLSDVEKVKLSGNYGARECEILTKSDLKIECQTPSTQSLGQEEIYLVKGDVEVKTSQSIGYSYLFGEESTALNTSILNGFQNPQSVDIKAGKMFITDNDRIKVWNSIPSTYDSEPDYVIGVSDKHKINHNLYLVRPSSTNYSFGDVISDGSRLYATSGASAQSRVYIWNSIPSTNTRPDIVLGQEDLESGGPNNGGLSASSLSDPRAIATDGTKLVVADSSNHRILIWNSIPTHSNQSADLVLGQPDFISNSANNGGRSASSLYSPKGVMFSGSKLLVSDSLNHRILIWNSFPTSNNQAADVVIGQADFTSSSTGVSASSLNNPQGIEAVGSGFAIVDSKNNRLLLYSSIPTVSGVDADVVIGQDDFVSNTADYNAKLGVGMSNTIKDVSSFGSTICYTDVANARVPCFNTIPTTNGVAADFVIGQKDLAHTGMRSEPQVSQSTLANLQECSFGPNGEFVITDGVDPGVGRVLFWNETPTSLADLPDFVLGQSDFNSGGEVIDQVISGDNIKFARSIVFTDDYLLISDDQNHRILGYTLPLSSNGQTASFVLGQPDLLSNSSNNGGVSDETLYRPIAMNYDGEHLIVTDLGNHRVLIWNSITGVTQQPADIVLGQASMTTRTSGLSQTQMKSPHGVYSDGSKLYISDWGNNRVLVWKTFPTTNNQAADYVLGQSDFDSYSIDVVNTDAQNIINPKCIFESNNILYVCDSSHHRYLGWQLPIDENNQAADFVVGQDSLYNSSVNFNYNNSALDNITADHGAISFDGKACIKNGSAVSILPFWK